MADKYIQHGPRLQRKLIEESMGDLLYSSLKNSLDNVILIDALTGEEATGKLILARSIQLARWFQIAGIGIGDSISICSENRIEFSIIPIAAFFMGITIAPLNPDYTVVELKHILHLSKPKAVFCSEKYINKMISVLPDHPYIQTLVVFDTKKYPQRNVISLNNDILKGINKVDNDFKVAVINTKETIATILCSSGTTGMPKGVLCTHDNMVCFMEVSKLMMSTFHENEDSNDAMIGLNPFFHSFGFMLMIMNLVRGKTMLVIRKYSLKLLLDTLVKYKIRRVIVSPPVLLQMLKNPLTSKYDLSFIREIRTGAASLGKEVEKELANKFSVKFVSQAYGLTETTLGVLMNSEDMRVKVGSVGKVVPGMMAKVIDEKGNVLGPNKNGELCFKGPLIMKGYVNNNEATSNTIDAEGWLHTGDIGYYDEEGYFFVVDRLKELIKYKAFQVAPAELESILLSHPCIADAAVIGLPNSEAGELPLAFVVKRPGMDVTEEEVKKLIADTLSYQKHLRGGVIFIDEIPKNPSGKILRRVLKERAIHLQKHKSKL
ncbi:hypothetical protein GWI33_018613 [Rhynchophorus ferrugineus]|uniref:Uncharacterized protein n=1 Tax=Rhynchophorus ferrugineus TaxID=354439 RepID=A0A834HXI7_RHYFE|nr:hypothetical protein GWI33_018613 [Rhynchophorus ferrugineus]